MGNYDEAVEWAAKAIEQNSRLPAGHRNLAASYGQLGRKKEAQSALANTLQLVPGLTLGHVTKHVPLGDPDAMDRYAEGLRKAGLPE